MIVLLVQVKFEPGRLDAQPSFNQCKARKIHLSLLPTTYFAFFSPVPASIFNSALGSWPSFEFKWWGMEWSTRLLHWYRWCGHHVRLQLLGLQFTYFVSVNLSDSCVEGLKPILKPVGSIQVNRRVSHWTRPSGPALYSQPCWDGRGERERENNDSPEVMW